MLASAVYIMQLVETVCLGGFWVGYLCIVTFTLYDLTKLLQHEILFQARKGLALNKMMIPHVKSEDKKHYQLSGVPQEVMGS